MSYKRSTPVSNLSKTIGHGLNLQEGIYFLNTRKKLVTAREVLISFSGNIHAEARQSFYRKAYFGFCYLARELDFMVLMNLSKSVI